jgi:hypothetical protein
VDCRLVFLAFCQPDCQYTSKSFNSTGLQFSSDFATVQGAIDVLKSKGSKVYLSIGGGSYQNWQKRNVKGCIQLAQDLHCDGIDIDWEKTFSDQKELSQILSEFYAAKTNLEMSAAVWSTGAYPNNGDTYAGVWIDVLKKQGQLLNSINLMAYGISI